MNNKKNPSVYDNINTDLSRYRKHKVSQTGWPNPF